MVVKKEQQCGIYSWIYVTQMCKVIKLYFLLHGHFEKNQLEYSKIDCLMEVSPLHSRIGPHFSIFITQFEVISDSITMTLKVLGLFVKSLYAKTTFFDTNPLYLSFPLLTYIMVLILIDMERAHFIIFVSKYDSYSFFLENQETPFLY